MLAQRNREDQDRDPTLLARIQIQEATLPLPLVEAEVDLKVVLGVDRTVPRDQGRQLHSKEESWVLLFHLASIQTINNPIVMTMVKSMVRHQLYQWHSMAGIQTLKTMLLGSSWRGKRGLERLSR